MPSLTIWNWKILVHQQILDHIYPGPVLVGECFQLSRPALEWKNQRKISAEFKRQQKNINHDCVQGGSVLLLSKHCTNTLYHFRLLLYCSEILLHLGIWTSPLKNNGSLYSGVTRVKKLKPGRSLLGRSETQLHRCLLFIQWQQKETCPHLFIYLFTSWTS